MKLHCSLAMLGMACLPLSSAFAATAAPVAFVYVASNYSGSNNQIAGYAVAANGQLTKVTGSPFYANVSSMAVNGKFLLGTGNGGPSNAKNVYSYLLNANGSLTYKGATNVQNGDPNSAASYITLDHSGADAYVWSADGVNYDLASYGLNASTGLLHSLDSVIGSNDISVDGPPYTVLSNNQFVYGVLTSYPYINFGIYHRQANGGLMTVNDGAPPSPTGMPVPGGALNFATADASNHLAMIATCNVGQTNSVNQVATYTANPETGALSTSSNCATMPTTTIMNVESTSMAYSGKILAVGGTQGLQLFNFSGTAEATPLGGPLLTGVDIGRVIWDSSNHLYAISAGSNKLYVMTVTSSGVTQAPGSPYTIASPREIIVQPK